ncbi:MAG: hypothetical protein R3C40_09240 [Parvularculaceae bacterium]
MKHVSSAALAFILLAACSPEQTGTAAAPAEGGAEPAENAQAYTVIIAGKPVGYMNVTRTNVEPKGADIAIDYDFKNNGRGPGFTEKLTIDEAGARFRGRLRATPLSAMRSRKITRATEIMRPGRTRPAPARRRSANRRCTSASSAVRMRRMFRRTPFLKTKTIQCRRCPPVR